MSTIEEILAKHVSDGNQLCYAPSLGPIMVKHSGGSVQSKMLRCTQKLGHDGDHIDANCCWTPHRFLLEQASPPSPDWHQWQRCKECKQDWPCDVVRLAEAVWP